MIKLRETDRDFSPHIFAELDRFGKVLSVENEELLFGIGENAGDVFPENSRIVFEQALQTARETGTPVREKLSEKIGGKSVCLRFYPLANGNVSFHLQFLEEKTSSSEQAGRAALSRLAAVLVFNSEKQILWNSRRFVEISRFSEEQIKGKFLQDFCPEEVNAAAFEDLNLSIKTGLSWKGELQFFNKRGRPFWLFASISILTDELSGEKRISLVGIDITQTKLTERLLIKSEKRFSDIYDKMPVVLIGTDKNLFISEVTSYCTEATGFEKQELLGKSLSEFILSDKKEVQSENHLKKTFLEAGRNDLLSRFRLKSGESIPVYLNASAVSDETGEISDYLISVKDITLLLRTRRELEEQKYALDHSAIVAILDTEGIIRYANSKFCSVTGYSAEELPGKPSELLDSGQHGPHFFARMEKTTAAGEVWRGEIRRKSKSGEFFWVDVTQVPMTDDEGRVLRILEVSFDITERKRMGEEIIKYSESLEEIISERTRELTVQTQSAQEANTRLSSQNEELGRKNKYIVDSINYAKRIQESILPTADELSAAFSDYFVLWKPKDVVSGDFYWYAQADGRHFIAAVDCTGHGVPGGFMFMIGHTVLNEIVLEKKIYRPADVLGRLHREVRTVLRQNETQNRDGMDIAFCTLFPKEGKLEFAGAHNPLVIYRENADLEVIKGDRLAIGGVHKPGHKFSQHDVKLDESAFCFIFTDGYADQFGGPEKRKMPAGDFRKLLTEIAESPADFRKKRLETLFEHRRKMAGEKQTDDVLIIGFRFPGA